jgi:tripartite-type tricarboxylate transporter receptor subunit TctC
MKRIVFLLGVTAALVFGAVAAHAAKYPEKLVSYLIPFNPGGESDIFARAQQPHLEKILGQRVLISYKTGGGGSLLRYETFSVAVSLRSV